MFIFIRKNGYYASQKRLCKQPVLRGGIFIAFSKGQFEVEKSPKIQLYQYVSGWLDTGKKFSGLIKKSACLLLPLNIGQKLIKSPCCEGGVLEKHGYYERGYKALNGREEIRLKILRVRCSACGKTHAILLMEMIPYARAGKDIVLTVLSNFESNCPVSSILEKVGGLVDENDLYRIIRNYKSNWKARMQSLRLSLSSFFTDFASSAVLCLDSFFRHFMQMRDRTCFKILKTT